MLQESRGRPVFFWRCPHSLLAVTLTQPPVQWTTYHLFPLCCVVAPHCISAGWIESATFSLLLPAFLSGGLIILSLARLPRNSGPEFNNERRAIIIIISPPPLKIGGVAVQWSLLVSPVSRNDSSLVKNRAGRRVVWKRSPSSSTDRPLRGRTSLLNERGFFCRRHSSPYSSYGYKRGTLIQLLSTFFRGQVGAG